MSQDKKKNTPSDQERENPEDNKVKPEQKPNVSIIPWIVLGLFTLFFAVKPVVSPPKVKEGYDYHAFGKLPVLLGGRIKPMDTVARTSLLQIAGQQRIALEGNGPNKEWGDLYQLSQEGNAEGLSHKKSLSQFFKHPRNCIRPSG